MDAPPDHPASPPKTTSPVATHRVGCNSVMAASAKIMDVPENASYPLYTGYVHVESRLQEVQQNPIHLVRLFPLRDVPRFRDERERRARQGRMKVLSHLRREHAVLGSPHDQRRGTDLGELSGKPLFPERQGPNERYQKGDQAPARPIEVPTLDPRGRQGRRTAHNP